MDWTKIKTRHFLNTDYTLVERGALITLVLLCAHLERIPTEKEMVRHTSKHALCRVRSKLEDTSTTLREVFGKVLEDVRVATGAKKRSAVTSKTHRNKGKSDMSRDNDRDFIEENREDKKDILEIINYLNSVCNTEYKTNTKKTKILIEARRKEGFTVTNFKAVIDKKHASWENKPDMIQYLRPETLFGTKFEGYLNEPSSVNKEVDKFAGETWGGVREYGQ